MIRFGAWSTLLAVLALQCVLLAALLLRMPDNRTANRYLGWLLVVIAGMLTPFILGYAGFYDAWPWLTAAPFAIPLAVGPLFYAHVAALGEGRAISSRHFAAPAIQFAYQATLFPFPVTTKAWWDGAVHQPLIGPLLAAAVLLSMASYTIATLGLLRRYQAWLAQRRRDPSPAKRIRLALVSLATLLVARALYDLFDALIQKTDYFDLFAFYVLLGVIGVMLGANGWRNARTAAPAISEPVERDWAGRGAEWIATLRAEGWWRDPELDLATLARRLGTNATSLSRALNEGHGGFASVLGSIRAEAVAQALEGPEAGDLLALAFEAGFGSKASFNRAFRSRFGTSPTAYRAARLRLNA